MINSLITFLVCYAGYSVALCLTAAGYAYWCMRREGDPLERIFADELAEIRQLPEVRERVR